MVDLGPGLLCLRSFFFRFSTWALGFLLFCCFLVDVPLVFLAVRLWLKLNASHIQGTKTAPEWMVVLNSSLTSP